MNPGRHLEKTRKKRPLVHFITNAVTVNDCANATLAVGASPIMADDPAEAADVSAMCQATVLNMGTPCERTVKAMVLAGSRAREQGHHVVFDPVGAGVSNLRKNAARSILDEVCPDIIKGNVSEIMALALGTGSARGVDVRPEDQAQGAFERHVSLARVLADRQKAVIVVTGPVDIVTDGRKTYLVRNGTALMETVSGLGCVAAGILGAFAGAAPRSLVKACAAAMACMGVAGEMAEKRLPAGAGSGTYHVLFLDALSRLYGERLGKMVCLERV